MAQATRNTTANTKPKMPAPRGTRAVMSAFTGALRDMPAQERPAIRAAALKGLAQMTAGSGTRNATTSRTATPNRGTGANRTASRQTTPKATPQRSRTAATGTKSARNSGGTKTASRSGTGTATRNRTTGAGGGTKRASPARRAQAPAEPSAAEQQG